MKLIIHDLDADEFQKCFPNLPEHVVIISNNGKVRHCTGCFGCWVKTPGKCVLKDTYDEMGKKLAQASEVICISRCTYGGYSPFVKNIWDRSIPYLLPFFLKKKGETHHKQRYKEKFQLAVYFYGEHISVEDKTIAEKLIKANALNFAVDKWKVRFSKSVETLNEEVAI